jgi:hypothetical protein
VLPLLDPNARFNDNFNSCDLRLSKDMRLREGMNLEVLGEVFNLFNVRNILEFPPPAIRDISTRWSRTRVSPTLRGVRKAGDHGGRNLRFRRAASVSGAGKADVLGQAAGRLSNKAGSRLSYWPARRGETTRPPAVLLAESALPW